MGALPRPDFDHTEQCKGSHNLTQTGPAYAELGRKVALWQQPVAGLEFSLEQLGLEETKDVLKDH